MNQLNKLFYFNYFLPHIATTYTHSKVQNYILFCPVAPNSASVLSVIALGEVEGCPPHHPASVAGRMDVSMWRGVSMRLLTVKLSQSGTALPSTGQCVAHSSPVQSSLVGLIQKGCVDVKGVVGETERLRVRNQGSLLPCHCSSVLIHTGFRPTYTCRDKKVTVHSTPTRLI